METQKKNTSRFRPNSGLKLIDQVREVLRCYYFLRVKRLHERNMIQGYSSVYLPLAVEQKYPQAYRRWIWQYVFPSGRLFGDPRTGLVRRHHVSRSSLQIAVNYAARLAEIDKRISCHTFRHGFAMQLLQQSYGIGTVQELLGHKDVQTTMIYRHVLNRGKLAVRSPLD
jgi:integrase